MQSSETTPLLQEDSSERRRLAPVNDTCEESSSSASVSTSAAQDSTNYYKWNVFQSCMNTLVHTLIGASVVVTLWFAFKSTPITAFQWHVGLCVIGYQLLMSHAILSLRNYNSWSRPLRYVHRRRVHWMLQLAGSVTAMVGSVLMMTQKTVNFNTMHGKSALAALIFTCLSLVNGVTSLYATELRRFMQPTLSKLSHYLFGSSAFVLASICLVFGYNKRSFKEWASEEFAYVMIGITCIYTFIIIAPPLYILCKKLKNSCKYKIF